MKRNTCCLVIATLLMVSPVFAGVTVKTEQINPADPAWKFKNIPGPSKSDVAQNVTVTIVSNEWDAAGGGGVALVNGRLPSDSLDLSEEGWLSNGNADDGRILVDLGGIQPVAAVSTYSWHEWNVDDGSRGPQVYTLYGSAKDRADPLNLVDWIKIADVDSRPNETGRKWNGQHGVFISDSTGLLGEFRYLLFALQRTRSPLQSNAGFTGTLFSEIDVHTRGTLAKAGDAVVVQPVKVTDVWVVFKTHLDIGYTDTIEEVLKKYRVSMMDGALSVIEASQNLPAEKRFAWTLAGWPLAHVLGPRQDPDRKVRIERAVREGAIAVHAIPFTLHTETDDLEDLVRGLGFASKIARTYGRPLPIGAKMTDVPCHSWVWPTLLSHAGVKFLQLGCNGTSAYVLVPPLFWWEGPDGSRILCSYTVDYGSGLTPPRNWLSRNYLALIMTGDNHGPPSPADVENIRQHAAKNMPDVRVHFGTLDDFARAVLAENPDLPVVRADMPDTWIHGWLSMPVEAKAARNFRPLEPALDTLDTQLRAWGLSTGDLAPSLAEAYELSDLFSEHTFGPWGPKGGPWESGIPKRYLYGDEWKAAYAGGAYKKYEQAFDDKRAFARKADDIVRRELGQRLDLLARSVKMSGSRIVVWNALPWPRSGLVEVGGKLFYATDVPASGYKTFAAGIASNALPVMNDPPTCLDTPFYKVEFDLKRGGIASLTDKRTGIELVEKNSKYVLGQFLHERFNNEQMLAFHKAYGRPGYSWPKGNLPTNTLYAALTPPAWCITVNRTPDAHIVNLIATDTIGLARGVAMIFTFNARQPWVEVEWRVTDKTPDPAPEGGWLCFPFSVADPKFLMGRLGGPVDPTRDIVAGANKYYFCLNSGLTIRGRDGIGVGLCPIDSSCVSLDQPGLWKFSLDYTPKKSSVFVNLYNNEWNTNFPEWQGGSWSSRVRFWPTADLVVPSWEARLPLLAVVADGSSGNLPESQSGLSVSRSGVLVTAFGKNPDGEGTLLRVWEQAGVAGKIAVSLPARIKVSRATPVNLRGEKLGSSSRIWFGKLRFRIGAFEPVSFILE